MHSTWVDGYMLAPKNEEIDMITTFRYVYNSLLDLLRHMVESDAFLFRFEQPDC